MIRAQGIGSALPTSDDDAAIDAACYPPDRLAELRRAEEEATAHSRMVAAQTAFNAAVRELPAPRDPAAVRALWESIHEREAPADRDEH